MNLLRVRDRGLPCLVSSTPAK